ncbi:hypothetical protein A2397_02165 [Candidatus Amesbacteria bacterium RIFOXYB1_FULL_44_23]|uniref:Uncharacterized protein n=1 Tax=Candidatus Amesbacteria bacterium RIFOXYB1_FULL_44_23 TaxID=1797263 RepID=A0A1F4ZT87_9BACT|nr:MAG: hypothetical protein A2397_02165 [Candidatus Amesbacteria bacterium RIFOXYB1_FULL_44_23]
MAKTGNGIEGGPGKLREVLVTGSILAIMGIGLIVLLEQGKLDLGQRFLEAVAILGVGAGALSKIKDWMGALGWTSTDKDKKS